MEWILTQVDVCSGYTVLRALKDKTMESVARELWRTMADYGTFKICQADNGKEFVNELLEQFAKTYGIDLRSITPYNPRGNGGVERKNQDVEKVLKRYMQNATGRWDEWLPLVQLCLNNCITAKVRSTPFALMYGRPFNEFRDFREAKGFADVEQAVLQRLKDQDNLREVILPGLLESSKDYKEKMRARMDSRKQREPFQVGQKVMAIDQTRASKWEPTYEGPFTVDHQDRTGAYILRDALGETLPAKRTASMLIPASAEVELGKSKERKELDLDTGGESTSENGSWEVRSVVDHRKASNGKGYDYLIRWKDYGPEDDTWEPEELVTGAPAAIAKYWKKWSASQKALKPAAQPKKRRRVASARRK